MERDSSFYNLFRTISNERKDKFKIVPYSEFEAVWLHMHGVSQTLPTITPIGVNPIELDRHIDGLKGLNSMYTADPNAKSAYIDPRMMRGKFITSIYANDNIYYKLNELFNKSGIPFFNGGWSHPTHMRECVAYVTFPDQFSKLAAFETVQNQVITFLPTEEYLIKLHTTHNNGMQYWFNSPLGNLNSSMIPYIHWYRFPKCRVFFSSLDDLVAKMREFSKSPSIAVEKKLWCRKYAKEIHFENMNMWSDIFETQKCPRDSTYWHSFQQASLVG